MLLLSLRLNQTQTPYLMCVLGLQSGNELNWDVICMTWSPSGHTPPKSGVTGLFLFFGPAGGVWVVFSIIYDDDDDDVWCLKSLKQKRVPVFPGRQELITRMSNCCYWKLRLTERAGSASPCHSHPPGDLWPRICGWAAFADTVVWNNRGPLGVAPGNWPTNLNQH